MKVIAVGDIHFPWEDKPSLKKIYSAVEKEQPDAVVQLGDIFDMFGASRFARSHNIFTPQKELDLGRSKAENFWHAIQKAAPKASCYQIKGNHDDRPYKRLLDRCPELESLFDLRSLFSFKGVHTVHDSREPLSLGGVYYLHGWLSNLGAHMDYFLRPVVCGHSHRGGVVYRNIHGCTIWECNAGYVANKAAVPLRYGPSAVSAMTLGYAQIDSEGPRFIPF